MDIPQHQVVAVGDGDIIVVAGFDVHHVEVIVRMSQTDVAASGGVDAGNTRNFRLRRLCHGAQAGNTQIAGADLRRANVQIAADVGIAGGRDGRAGD